ncbi:hypothetical protein NEIG_01371 [Nematocida sp. ERTm5]|nr:hypothetical protein NEIG_01371 [Nematocida sp. ERTm5]
MVKYVLAIILAMECTTEELFQVFSSLIEDLNRKEINRYRRKMINLYINLSIDKIYRKETSLPMLYSLSVCMYSILQNAQDNEKVLKSEIREKLQKEVLNYASKREVLKIRAIILDMFQGTYTENSNYSVKPEQWAIKIVEDIRIFIGESKNNTKDKEDVFKEPKRLILERVEDLLAEEIKEAFLSKSKPFGKKGNQLIINILYIKKYLNSYVKTESMQKLIETVQENFKDPNAVESDLSEYI